MPAVSQQRDKKSPSRRRTRPAVWLVLTIAGPGDNPGSQWYGHPRDRRRIETQAQALRAKGYTATVTSEAR